LAFLPPYSPELNPAEHLWDCILENWFQNKTFNSLDAVEDTLVEAVVSLENESLPTEVTSKYPELSQSCLVAKCLLTTLSNLVLLPSYIEWDCNFPLTFISPICYKPRTIVSPYGVGAAPRKVRLKGKKVKILRCPATVTGDERRMMPLGFPGRRDQ